MEKWKNVKKSVCVHLVSIVLIVLLVPSVHASVTVQATIDQDVAVTFNLANINSTIYWTIKNEQLITESTIPNVILENLEQQNLTDVDIYSQSAVFNDLETSIYLAFSLTGSNILDFTASTKTMTRIFTMRTDWRKFQLNLTDEFSLDFNEGFGEPLERWQRINYPLNAKVHPTYCYNSTDSSTLDAVCYFILPASATNVQVAGDLLAFELPLPFADSLLNSPFLILVALIGVNIAFFAYRKIRK